MIPLTPTNKLHPSHHNKPKKTPMGNKELEQTNTRETTTHLSMTLFAVVARAHLRLLLSSFRFLAFCFLPLWCAGVRPLLGSGSGSGRCCRRTCSSRSGSRPSTGRRRRALLLMLLLLLLLLLWVLLRDGRPVLQLRGGLGLGWWRGSSRV